MYWEGPSNLSSEKLILDGWRLRVFSFSSYPNGASAEIFRADGMERTYRERGRCCEMVPGIGVVYKVDSAEFHERRLPVV